MYCCNQQQDGITPCNTLYYYDIDPLTDLPLFTNIRTYQVSSQWNLGLLDDNGYFYDNDDGVKEDYYLKEKEHFNYELISDIIHDNWEVNP